MKERSEPYGSQYYVFYEDVFVTCVGFFAKNENHKTIK